MKIKNTKLLFIYRHSIFKIFSFETDNKDLQNITKALNIKKRKDRIEYVYDEAIKYINNYYSEDLCKFKNGKCIVQRQNKKDGINGCCRYCHLVTEKGCPSANLACKLLYCKTALGNIKLLKLREIPILKCLSIWQRSILKGSFFETKEEVIKDLYYGPVYSAFKNIFKEIPKIFKNRYKK